MHTLKLLSVAEKAGAGLSLTARQTHVLAWAFYSIEERNKNLFEELEQAKKVANDQAQLAAKYRRMLDAARDAYIKEHSDGETDCVTPFDVYEL